LANDRCGERETKEKKNESSSRGKRNAIEKSRAPRLEFVVWWIGKFEKTQKVIG
jgi:hypothetical protein